jgi:RNA polymerase sigma factor (sigma-70 family)
MQSPVSTRAGQNGYLMAVVLGTALSALGPTAGQAASTVDAPRAVHELSRYCTACWRNARLDPGCWGDCTQEVLCRLLERVPPASWDAVLHAEGEERKEFLRAIDAVKKRTQRQRRWSAPLPDSIADRYAPVAERRAEERRLVEQAAAEMLSPRQQGILQMSFEGWSVQDVAGQLRMSPERVSDEKYKAIRKLRSQLCQSEREAR